MGKIIQALFGFFGLQLHVQKHRGWVEIRVLKKTNALDAYITIQSLLKYSAPKVVYDIGANDGLWIKTLSDLDSRLEKAYLFEPQTKYKQALENKLAGRPVDVQVYPIGVGNENTTMRIKGGTHSASFLDVSADYAFAGELTDEEETVAVWRLDDWVKDKQLAKPDLIKIDVQGYELEVLRGATEIIKDCSFIILELSFDEFYLGQNRLSELFAFLEDHGFILIDTGFEWRKDYKINNRLLQTDGIFANKKLKIS